MDKETLKKGIAELNSLAQEEYHQSLEEVLEDSDLNHSAVRIGRLVGVMLKEPFSTSESLNNPTYQTAAFRAWHLNNASEFNKPEKAATWQYQTLSKIQSELARDNSYYEKLSVYQFAEDAGNELGFFGSLTKTLKKYICGVPEIREKVENALGNAGQDGKQFPTITPESIVGAGGLALGAYLIEVIPVLGFVGAPVIAAVLIILYTLGVHAFCESFELEQTNEIENEG